MRPRKTSLPSLLSAFVIVLVTGPALLRAGTGVELYRDTIKPVFRERCYACHGALKQKAGLRVDTVDWMKRGSTHGSVLADPKTSALLARLTHDDPEERMPPDAEPLSPEEIAAIRTWIEAGAPGFPDEPGDDDPASHWAFQPIEKPAVPAALDSTPGGNPIDAFLEAKRAAHSLKTQPSAERSLALRRLYLDLVGLPPTTAQLHDDRPWAEIVDELLASPQHGERWARHWMDVWRYSDWYGLGAQLRYSQKHLWHWRDWIVESLNADKGYDRMILEMLAGDEIAPEDPEVLRATGFLARNYFLFNRTTWLDTTIEHTGKAFLGLTLNCAKCHDHKYDPIDQEDYYRLRAIFEPHQVRLDPVPGVTDFEKDGLPRVFDNHPDAVTRFHLRGDPKQPDENREIIPAVPRAFAGFAPEIQPVSLPASAYAPGSRPYAQRDRLAAAEAVLAKAEQALAQAREAEETREGEAAATSDEKGEPAPPFHLVDDFDGPRPESWDILGDGWKYENGRLLQARATREPTLLRSREDLPRDFELTCRFTTTGGDLYKSVTFRFDLAGDDREARHANFVYTSEHAPGPKVQAAYTRGGKTTYPGEGRKTKSARVGEPQELRFAVRENLVNVWLDGKFAFAYRFPGERRPGRFALSAFDATAAFDRIEIRSLPADLKLTDVAASEKSTPDENALANAEAELSAARAELVSLEATVAADRARFSGRPQEDLEEKAALLQARARKSRAEADLVLPAGDAKKRKAAEQSLADAKKTLAALEKGEGSADYAPLRASRKALETPEHTESDYPSIYPEISTGRRTMLARWMVSPDNPLTARVAVNHVWMRHFGEPLVPTVFDFGRQAPEPEHRELLDYLAAEFIDSGWSFRHLHRLMVNSAAYRLSSSNAGADSATRAGDPENRYYWRMNPRRMESQVVRDSLLQLAGKLDPTLGGPSIDPGAGGFRRSLYFTHSPEKLDLFLTMFDEADLQQCYRRSESIVPQQALALANSDLSFTMAEAIAGKLASFTEADAFITAAFEHLLARAPDPSELAECHLFFDEWKALDSPDRETDRMRVQFVHALLNHNDFVTIR